MGLGYLVQGRLAHGMHFIVPAELHKESIMDKPHAQHILLALIVICALIAIYEVFL